MRKKILIYCDYGCSNIEVLKRELKASFKTEKIDIEQTDSQRILKENHLNSNVLAFVMPGGAATPYYQKLKLQGNDKIRNYVTQGGIYLGICAGAYYACHQTIFEKNVPELTIQRQCGLELINATAIGTLYRELKISPYSHDASSETIVPILWHSDKECHFAHYHGGPWFTDLDNQCEVIASYDTEPRKPAIVQKKMGKGLVLLCGVHFENTSADLLKRIFNGKLDEELARANGQELKIHEISRQQLSKKIFNIIKTF